MRQRRKAAGLRPVVTWMPRLRPLPALPLEFRGIQARSLALHALVARKIEHDPQLLEVAHRSLERWRQRGSPVPGTVIRAWRKLLRRPWPEIWACMTAQTEEGVRLRSTTPFLDVLTPRERRRLYEAFQAMPGKVLAVP